MLLLQLFSIWRHQETLGTVGDTGRHQSTPESTGRHCETLREKTPIVGLARIKNLGRLQPIGDLTGDPEGLRLLRNFAKNQKTFSKDQILGGV